MRHFIVFTILCVSLLFNTNAYGFSLVSSSGQTLYYNIVATGKVAVTYPGQSLTTAYSGYNRPTGDLIIPNSVSYLGHTYSVISINEGAFLQCDELTSVSIPNTITSIGNLAFYGCTSLTSVDIPNSVTTIGTLAFSNVHHIEYHGSASGSPWDAISMNGVLEGNFVYSDTTKHHLLAYLGTSSSTIIPNTVDTIGNKAFYRCVTLNSVSISQNVTTIGDFAFYGCSGLTSVTIPNSVTIIGSHAFSGCNGLASMTIGDGVTTINEEAFSHCENLSCVIIPNSVISIGSSAFRYCSNLHSVTIGHNVVSINENAFRDSDIDTVVLRPTIPPALGNNAFGSPYDKLFFLIGCSYDDYYDNSYWNNYRSRIRHPLYNITISLSVNDSIRGTASVIKGPGNRDVRCDSTAVVVANANYGYHFTAWNDGDTSNPRVTTLTQDTNFTAMFDKNQYTILGTADDSIRGDVSGSSIVDYLDTVTLTATANYGYHFVRWNDNITQNPRAIQVTKDTTYTAFFTNNIYYFSLYVDTVIHGEVECSGNGGWYGDGYFSAYLSEINMFATPNYGYHFISWSDGDTNNPRVFILTQDTIFTAMFAPNQYTITGSPVNETRGVVTGGCTVDYLDSVTITATANYGYHFTRWQDYNTDNPRRIQVTQNKTYTAYFDFNQYSITLDVDTNIHGTVNGGGNYNFLSNRTITATPNYGYHFTQWNDGDTNNPRVLTLTQDTAFTALFAKNTYIITAISNDTIRGMVTGSTSTEYLDSVTITATPNYGYHFTAWNDGENANPRTIEATKDSLFTAYFGYNQYTITLNVDTNIHGLVTGGGLYNYISEQTIAATANYGYHFTAWNDGDTTNPRIITLTQDTSFTALFAKNTYTLTGLSADTIRGSVSGSTTMEYLDSVSIAATANYGYHFLYWNDGDTTNPRIITLTQDTVLTACFAKNWYSVIGTSDNETMGYVTGSDTVEYLDNVSLFANSNYGYHFSSWNDGDTNNPRVICMTQDTTFTAMFAKNQYTLTVQSNDETLGSVSNGGVFDYLDTVTIIASASEHYHFVQWNDGNTDNPREYVIVGDVTLTAIFAIDTHTVNVTTNDIARGMVEATGTEFSYGTPCTVTATAYTGYVFSRWSNGITANPYTFAVLEDTELMAIFEEEGTQGIDDVANIDNIRVFSKYDRILIDGLNSQDVTIYTIDGRVIATLPKATEHVAIPATNTGVYIVKIGEYPARKVVVIR